MASGDEARRKYLAICSWNVHHLKIHKLCLPSSAIVVIVAVSSTCWKIKSNLLNTNFRVYSIFIVLRQYYTCSGPKLKSAVAYLLLVVKPMSYCSSNLT